MTVAELDERMSLAEYLEWQAFDQWRVDEQQRREVEREALESGVPTEEMRDEARAEFTMREQAAAEARQRGLPVTLADEDP
jgi:hypothetical protein